MVAIEIISAPSAIRIHPRASGHRDGPSSSGIAASCGTPSGRLSPGMPVIGSVGLMGCLHVGHEFFLLSQRTAQSLWCTCPQGMRRSCIGAGAAVSGDWLSTGGCFSFKGAKQMQHSSSGLSSVTLPHSCSSSTKLRSIRRSMPNPFGAGVQRGVSLSGSTGRIVRGARPSIGRRSNPARHVRLHRLCPVPALAQKHIHGVGLADRRRGLRPRSCSVVAGCPV